MMTRRGLLSACVAVLGIVVLAVVLGIGSSAIAADDPNSAVTFSGPYTHKNLTIYLVHAPDRIQIKDFLTLQEALDKQKAVLAETSNVNELTIENQADVPIYIHSGAIIKGGKQDRVIQDDYVVPPRTKISLRAFCVEQGRWRQRGSEAADKFSDNRYSVSSRELKLAVRSSGKQQDVWQEVASSQEKLGAKTGGSVQAGESRTSLQLSLENKKVQEAAAEYRKALAEIVKDRKDVVGYAFAVNGQVNSVDVYGAHALFVKLWPQLLDSTAIEAVASYEKGKDSPVPDKEAVRKFLEESRQAKASQENVGKSGLLLRRESDASASFTTVDKSQPGAAPIRENAIKKK